MLATVEGAAFRCAISTHDIWSQGDGDLGVRIERIFARALESAPAAIAIGADSPLLTTAHLREALEALGKSDAVLGRCEDGGFYLLGLRRCPAGVFLDLPWSCGETAAAMERRLRKSGFSVHELQVLFDVDIPEDLARLDLALNREPSLAPATHAWCVQNAAGGL